MKAKPGHIIDDQGIERKVLGHLLHTLDGAVIGEGATFYYREKNPRFPIVGEIEVTTMVDECDYSRAIQCVCDNFVTFSTREAAEEATK